MKTPKQLRRMLAAVLVVLAGLGTVVGLRGQAVTETNEDPINLSAKDILDKVRLAYASISTYRDSGYVVQQYQGKAWTNTFTEVLGTRNFYRVEVCTWLHGTKRFWCDGLKHYRQMEGEQVEFHGGELSVNLLNVADDTAVPAVYYLLSWGNIFTKLDLGPDAELIRKPDEAVGHEICYMVSRPDKATIWVAQSDFLIRRCQLNGRLETHENIFTNEQFRAEDFVPVIQHKPLRLRKRSDNQKRDSKPLPLIPAERQTAQRP